MVAGLVDAPKVCACVLENENCSFGRKSAIRVKVQSLLLDQSVG